MAKLFNRAKMTTSTTGTGTITLGSASNGFQSFADAGVANGDVVQYVIEEGSNFEIGTGTYTSSGTTLSRTPTESSNSDAAITLAGQATVSITAVAADMNRLQHSGSDKVTVSSTGASVTGNISVTGTVDGRDVATDGSKLDGIESGATADQTAAEIRSLVESATDSNVFTDADHTKLNGIATNANNYSLPLASSSTRGGVKVGYTENGKNYPVELSSEKMYVNVPWTDNNTTYSTATSSTLGLVKIGYTENGKNYPVELSSGQMYVNVPWTDTDTNTTYSAGSGLSLSGTTFSHTDTSSQASVNNSGNTVIQDVTLDTYGHVTGLTSKALSIPAAANNATITLSAGTGLSGGGNFTTNQSSNETITFNMSSTPSLTSATFGSGVTLAESSDRADLLQITSNTSTWGGLQIRNSSNEGRWSFMTDGSTAGLYDDENGDWHMQMQENGGVTLYANGTANFTTGTTYMEMARHLDMNNYDIYGCDIFYHHGDTNTYMQFHNADQWRVVVGGSERLEVKNSSPHVLVTGDLNSTSDARLKENVEPIANALSDITQLEGVSFDWKDTGTRGHGFIAQQVEPILPDVVQTDEETGIKSINYVGMIGHLVEAIKELKAEIEELKR